MVQRWGRPVFKRAGRFAHICQHFFQFLCRVKPCSTTKLHLRHQRHSRVQTSVTACPSNRMYLAAGPTAQLYTKVLLARTTWQVDEHRKPGGCKSCEYGTGHACPNGVSASKLRWLLTQQLSKLPDSDVARYDDFCGNLLHRCTARRRRLALGWGSKGSIGRHCCSLLSLPLLLRLPPCNHCMLRDLLLHLCLVAQELLL